MSPVKAESGIACAVSLVLQLYVDNGKRICYRVIVLTSLLTCVLCVAGVALF